MVEVVSPIASNLNSKEPLAQAQQDGNVDISSHKTLSAGRIAEEINERMGVDKKIYHKENPQKYQRKLSHYLKV